MIEVRGDIWQMNVDAVVVTTNGMRRKDGTAVMGAGIAKAACRRYPGIDRKLGDQLHEHGNHVHLLHSGSEEPWPDESRGIVAFPTKEHWKEPSKIELIHASALELVELVTELGWQQVALPQPGCGLGGLEWKSVVRPELENVFDDRFLVSAGL